MVFTAAQTAKICRVATRTICKWFDNGRLKGYRVGPTVDGIRIPRDSLITFMKECGTSFDVPDEAKPETLTHVEIHDSCE